MNATPGGPRRPGPSSAPAAMLAVFIEQGCGACAHALDLAERVRRSYPDVAVEVLDIALSSTKRYEGVFAVPTFVLDGEVVSLGTPGWDELAGHIEARLPRTSSCHGTDRGAP